MFMSDACTIYAERVSYSEVYDVIKVTSKNPLEIVGSPGKWQQIKIVGNNEITFTTMEGHPGRFDNFSELILGTYAFFQHIEDVSLKNRERVLRSVSECQFAIGISANPSFNEGDNHFDMIFAITKALNGLIFNGYAMIDGDGATVFDNEGSSDLV